MSRVQITTTVHNGTIGSAIIPQRKHSIQAIGRSVSAVENLSSFAFAQPVATSTAFNLHIVEAKKAKDFKELLTLAKAYELKGNYEKAFELFGEAAEAGSEAAEVVVGRYYAHGLGVKKSKSKAAEFFKSAADTGYPAGLYFYGEALMKGSGVHKDKHVGGAYILIAAKLNYPPAMYKLGYLCEKGKGGMTKNKEEAERWYKKSAASGNSLALSKIARNRKHARTH